MRKMPVNPVMIDVGAQVGTACQDFAERGWRIYCFEPEPGNYAELKKNMEKYEKVECIQKAVCEKDSDKVDFFVSNKHWGIHTLKPFHKTHKPKIQIQSIRLDTFIKENKIEKVDYLKIDVEGADYNVIKSIDLGETKPSIVMSEFMDDRSKKWGYTHQDMIKHMNGYGYDVLMFEYEKITEYGVRGGKENHGFRGYHKPTAGEKPAWGNLIFYQDPDLLNAVKKAENQKPLPVSWIPKPIKKQLKPIKMWLDAKWARL